MKRLLLLPLTIVLVLATSCDKEETEEPAIWDFACYSARFFVLDSATGANLLDPDAGHNILDQPIAVVYKGVRYEVEEAQDIEVPMTDTRFYMPKPLALRWFSYIYQYIGGRWEEVEGKYCLEFGEFTPEDDWHGEEFTIEWGDGTSNTVRFDLYIIWRHVNDPDVFTPLWLDGVPHDGWSITLRK